MTLPTNSLASTSIIERSSKSPELLPTTLPVITALDIPFPSTATRVPPISN